MASGLPKDLAMIGASANARFRPWQLSCPKPPSGFSPWRMKTIVSTAFSVCPASPPKSGTGHNKAETTAVLTSTLKVKLRIKLVNSGRSPSVQLRDYNSRPLSAPDTARFRTALSCALRRQPNLSNGAPATLWRLVDRTYHLFGMLNAQSEDHFTQFLPVRTA